jgi:hypothetical protein
MIFVHVFYFGVIGLFVLGMNSLIRGFRLTVIEKAVSFGIALFTLHCGGII